MSRPRKVEPLPRTGYTVPEVAQSLGIPQHAVRRLIHNQRLAAIPYGQRFIVPADALNAFLASAQAAAG